MDSIDLTRRQILLSGAVSGLLGAGVTGSVGLSDITGESSIQAEQALELVGVTAGSADSDTSFTRVSDDDTTFGAVVELNNGDSSEILIDIHNNSSAALKTQATIKKPSSLSVSPRIADDDDLQGDNKVIQTSKDTYVFTIPAQRTIQFILTVSVPDTASSDASDVQMSFDPLSTSKDENPSTDSGPIITNAKLFDTADSDGVVSAGETVRVEATVTEFNGLKSVKTSAQEFDPDSEPITLTDDGPGVSQSDDKFSGEFIVGEDADEGENRTIGITASDNEGVITEETANSLDINKTVETDNDAPTVSGISLTDNTDEDGVVSTDDEVEITATVTDAETSQEITTITADAGDFGAGTVTLYDTDSPTGNSGGGTRTESATFTVGSDSDATEGTGQTITLTVEDENGDEITDVDAAAEFNQTLEVDNDAPTIESATLTDVPAPDSDGVVSDGEQVKVEATVEDASNAGEITKVTADASAFGAGTEIELSNTDTSDDAEASGGGERTVSDTFTVGSDSNATDGNQSVTVTATDENDDESSTTSNSLTVDTSVPTIGNVTLSSQSGINGVADVGDTIRVTAKGVSGTTTDVAEVKVKDSDNPFRDEQITLSDDGPGVDSDDNDYSKEFEVSSEATPGESSTLTVTVTDEAGNTNSKNSGSDSLTVPPGTDKLVSYWKLDDVESGEVNVTDYVGSNTGTIEEDPGTPDNVSSTTLSATGTPAAMFKHKPDEDTEDINNGYIDCGSDASLDVGNEFTVSAYFKPTDLSETSRFLDEGIVSRDTGPTVGSDKRIWSLRVKEETDKVIFAVQNESNGFKQAKTESDIEDGATYHAIGRFNGKDLDLSVKKIDSNGIVSDVDKANNSFSGSVSINTNSDVPLRIGFYFADNARTMDGVINEVKLFETRLSDSDVDDLHTITG